LLNGLYRDISLFFANLFLLRDALQGNGFFIPGLPNPKKNGNTVLKQEKKFKGQFRIKFS